MPTSRKPSRTTERVRLNGGTLNKKLTLEIPLLPEYVSTARLFIAALSQSFDLDEEVVADLKVAVSEACTAAIQADRNGDGLRHNGPVTVEIDVGSDSLTIQISSSGDFGPAPDDAWDPDTPTDLFQKALGIGVIHSLFPDVEYGEEPAGGTAIRLRVPLQSSIS